MLYGNVEINPGNRRGEELCIYCKELSNIYKKKASTAICMCVCKHVAIDTWVIFSKPSWQKMPLINHFYEEYFGVEQALSTATYLTQSTAP